MRRLSLRVLSTIAATACMGCSGLHKVSVTGEPETRAAACADSLRLAQTIDTLTLARREVSGPPGASAEGSSIVEFARNGRRNAVSVTFYGERGRLSYSYRLASDRSYVVLIEDEQYREPLTTGPPSVGQRSSFTYRVCGGRVQGPDSAATRAHEAQTVLSMADSVLSHR